MIAFCNMNYDSGISIFFRTAYSFEKVLLFINILTVIEMSANVIQIEYRLRSIRDILQDFCLSKNSTPGTIDVVAEKNWLYFSKDKENAKKIKGNSSHVFVFNHVNDLSWLNKCYLLLIQQSTFINTAFGVRDGLIETKCLTASQCAGWIWVCAVMFFGLMYRCEKTYEQREQIIGIVDHILVSKDINTSTRKTLTEFRRLVCLKPVEFTAARIQRLDYGSLITYTSVVMTFTVLLLQNIEVN
ncbi:uncharacterized protein LOC135080190 [Ostrinia nubilalis]|uniref:uncharacterized protein LOC135080190 n=1 Tax=Ostrinia nubilalis TaxID=29057 RepID=UPI00308264D1